MMFRDRAEAGELLARELIRYKGAPGTVLFALPRGGVAVAHSMARILELPIDLVITRKIGHPILPEYAIAAVGEDGALITNERECEMVNPVWLESEAQNETHEAQRRRLVYMKGKKRHVYDGMTAIIVDDGAATGLTLEAAIASVKKHDPKRIVVAIPVMPADVARSLSWKVDELIVLNEDKAFRGAVGAYYGCFEQLSDKDVCDLLTSDHFYDGGASAPPQPVRELLSIVV